ncbi:MAG: DUF2254 domain-containing protein, partial [Alphaproteobacteria bacterium]|nr:DUF2254 domain-containing protein [Alphaproteobacteria bacterium]
MLGQREGQDDKPPILFRGRYVPHWAVATGIVLSLMAYFQYMGHDSLIDLTKDGVEAMLHATAGIFATMLAVTLGVTLLGVQFRSQSYTMSGMLEYMKDKVVYGFITVFVAGTILSMVVAGDPGSSPGWTALYALTCMALALCYHAAYIFHLIYKLQLSQMLSDNDKKILKYIDDAEKRDRLYTRFEIWEGIMEKAAETRNRSIFERGLKSAFSTMKKCI